MAERHLVVIQKQDSPMRPVVDAVGFAEIVWRRQGPPVPSQAFSALAVSLWDLYGFDGEERDRVADELAVEAAGVVVLCVEPDAVCQQLLSHTGALGLACHRQGPEALAIALELARAAQARLSALASKQRELERQLSERLLVEDAKRLLMSSQGLSEDAAHRRLQRHARDTNQKLVEVARQLLAGYGAFGKGKPEDRG